MKLQQAKQLSTERSHFWFALLILVITSVPRLLYQMTNTAYWHGNARIFLDAISQGDWAATYQTTHPGVTVMWLGAIARWLTDLFGFDFVSLSVRNQITIELVPLVLGIAFGFVWSFYLLRRLFDTQIALVAILLLAVDPFHIYVSKILHPDAIMSTLMLLSTLYLFTYQREQRAYYLVLSGIFAGVAILAKTPALFMLPFFLLWLASWQIMLWTQQSPRPPLLMYLRQSRIFQTSVRAGFLWLIPLLASIYILWPAMWFDPLGTLFKSIGGTLFYQATAHENPIYFLGESTVNDPGWLFYPLTLTLKTTVVTLPLLLLSLPALFQKRFEGNHRFIVLMSWAFLLCFMVQMMLGDKKFTRYALPTAQFVIIVGALGGVSFIRYWFGKHSTAFIILLVGLISVQTGIAAAQHPYYNVHFNRFFGTPQYIYANKIVPPQEEGEGLEQAGFWLSSLPNAPLLSVAAQNTEGFDRYFSGRTMQLTEDSVVNGADYLVFTHNWTLRGIYAHDWGSLWSEYQHRVPKHTISIDGVPHVWIYKVSPVITPETIPVQQAADLGQSISLLGHSAIPDSIHSGETFTVTLFWKAHIQPMSDFTVFVHLLDADGQLIGQYDGQPQGGLYPTFLWGEGEQVADTVEVNIPQEVLVDSITVSVGMYTLATGAREPLTINGVRQLNDALVIGEIRVLP